MNSKKAMDLICQIENLKKYKRVKFDEIDIEEAKKILYFHNYTNVITPFKHYFYLKDKNGYPLKDESGRHQYDKEIDFKNYYDNYTKERENYSIIYRSIYEFETHLKSVIIYRLLIRFDTSTEAGINDFIEFLCLNILVNQIPKERVGNLKEYFNDVLKKDLLVFCNHFTYLDSLSIKDFSNIFHCLDLSMQKEILNDLYNIDKSLGVNDIDQFKDRLFRVVSIRNYVMHARSLTILCRFYTEGDLRERTDRRKFENLIKYLSNKKENV